MFGKFIDVVSKMMNILKADTVCDLPLRAERIIEERDELQAKLEEIHDVLYGYGYEISNFHLNSDVKNLDDFFENNDWNPLEVEK